MRITAGSPCNKFVIPLKSDRLLGYYALRPGVMRLTHHFCRRHLIKECRVAYRPLPIAMEGSAS